MNNSSVKTNVIFYDIPNEIVNAANLIDNWMKKNNQTRWEFMNICSRNYADDFNYIKAYTNRRNDYK